MLDIVIVFGCGIISYFLHPVLEQYLPFVKGAVPFNHHATLIFLWLPLWIGAVIALGLHRVFDRPLNAGKMFWEVAKLHAICFLAISVVAYITQLDLNRSLVAVFLVLSFCVVYLVHLFISARLLYQYQKGHARKNVLMVGNTGEAMKTFIASSQQQKFAPKILGRLVAANNEEIIATDEDGRLPTQSPEDVLGTVADFGEYLSVSPVDEVCFFAPFNNPAENTNLLNICEELGVPAYFCVNMEQPTQAAPRFAMQHKTAFILFDIAPKRPDLLAIKHAFDAFAAFIFIAIFSPIMLASTLGILLTMGRPILFFQKRAGRFGREFNMMKFRTMKVGAEKQRDDLLGVNEMDGPVFKVTNDPRITRLGSFLRRFSIDELPQLFNVLNGTMSLTGPRPLPVQEQQGITGWRRRRLSMKPGITGIWQVSGRNEISFEEWMKMDVDYIDRWSLWLDITLLFRTIRAVIFTKGAK